VISDQQRKGERKGGRGCAQDRKKERKNAIFLLPLLFHRNDDKTKESTNCLLCNISDWKKGRVS